MFCSGPPYSLPLAETSSLANVDLAGRFYLACRGVPDYLMTLVRGAAAEAIWSAATCRRFLFRGRMAQRSRSLVGKAATKSKAVTSHRTPKAADQTRAASVGLSPRASGAKRRPAKATDYLGGRP